MEQWRETADKVYAAIRTARRLRGERTRVSRREGRETRLPGVCLPGVSGLIFHLVWDFLLEGAVAGAGREVTTDDIAALGEAYQLTVSAVSAVVASFCTARAEARGDEDRYRRLRRAAIESAPYVAAAIGYGAMRPSSRKIELVWSVGKERPETEIAVLALSMLGHSGESIARELRVNPRLVRRMKRSAGLS